jgi:hypothetical protein
MNMTGESTIDDSYNSTSPSKFKDQDTIQTTMIFPEEKVANLEFTQNPNYIEYEEDQEEGD